MVDRLGELYTENAVTAGKQADVRYISGKVRVSQEKFSITAGDESGSTYLVAVLPRDAVLLPTTGSRIVHGANMPDDLDLGDSSNPDGLVDGYDGSAAPATHSFGPAIADVGKELWELLGYATKAEAPSVINLFATRKSASTQSTTATGFVEIHYTVD